ncbi:MAG TPA: TadE family protein [Myxococcaceae bacterium]|nr:TadE family protein [Myxococcaceae bacterium]
MRRAPRGQSMVELALALIVFVTVIMFGIHFAEVGYLSLKVHEAAVSPMWDATALRTHRIRHHPTNIGDFRYVHSIAPVVTQDARQRYRDFDGRSSTENRPRLTHVFTQISNMQVHCQADAEVEFDVPRGGGATLLEPRPGGFPQGSGSNPCAGCQASRSLLDGIFENVGGMSCRAEAHVQALPTLPSRFLEGATGFFQAKHSIKPMIKACAAGRVAGGECQGRYGILLGDFSFVDPDVVGQCPLRPELPDEPCSENEAFYYAAKKVYDGNGRSAGNDASKFAQHFVGFSPIDESGFFMSYRPEETGYLEPLTPPGEPEDEAQRPRGTGGVGYRPAIRRPNNECFLGQPGC